MNKFLVACASAACLMLGSARAQVLANDSADDADYAFGWIEFLGAGTGFEPWIFASSSANGDGFAGTFLASEPNDGLSNVATGALGNAWALFANGGTGEEASAAFRGISDPIDAGGVSLSCSYEHGFIADGGIVGFSLRTGNAADSPSDYDLGSRFQFFFQGGTGNYTVVDGDGVLDTDIPFGLDGMTVTVTFTSANTYTLRVVRFGDELGSTLVYNLPERSLAGAGTIGSIALFNTDGGSSDAGLNNDVFFNSLRIEIPSPIDLDINEDDTLNFFDVTRFLELFEAAT